MNGLFCRLGCQVIVGGVRAVAPCQTVQQRKPSWNGSWTRWRMSRATTMQGKSPLTNRYEGRNFILRHSVPRTLTRRVFLNDVGNLVRATLSSAHRFHQAGRRLGKRHLQTLLVAVGRDCLRGTNTAEEKVIGCCVRRPPGYAC